MRIVEHQPVWVPAPIQLDREGNTRPGYVCVHQLENGHGTCMGNVFDLADVVGTHSCVVREESNADA